MDFFQQRMTFEVLLAGALILDLLLGDPRWYPHPVRIIGAVAARLEDALRRCISQEKAAGILTAAATLLVTTASVSILLYAAGKYSELLQVVLSVLLVYSLIAIKDLLAHSNDVYLALVPKEDIALARTAVGRIVGRDTLTLQRGGVCRACIETVAENMVDGISAPLLWAVFFSLAATFLPFPAIALAAVGMTAYKTINTMDSMFGYKTDRYIRFGWAPARLDDLANFIPARLSAITVIMTSALLGYDGRGSFRVFLRDRLNHSSPNAAHTEAAIAGALGLRLGGPSSYFGKTVNKPFIGDGENQATPQDILKTNRIVFFSSLLFVFLLLLMRNICI